MTRLVIGMAHQLVAPTPEEEEAGCQVLAFTAEGLAEEKARVAADVAGALHSRRAAMRVSRLQGRLVLGEAECARIDALADDPETPWAMRETIRHAAEWQRLAPAMDELAWILGYEPEQMDALFEQAMQVAV